MASAEQAADIFTKAVIPGKWDHALELLNLVDPSSSGAKPYDGAKIVPKAKKDIVGALPESEFEVDDCGGLSGTSDVNLKSLAVTIPAIHKGAKAVADIGERQKDYYKAVRSSPDKETVADKVHRAFLQPMTESKKRERGEREQRASGKLPGWGHFVELCTPKDSTLGLTAREFKGVKVMRVTKEMDILNDDFFKGLCAEVKKKPGTCLHASLPCTPWSQWQSMALHKYGAPYARDLAKRRAISRKMLARFIYLAEIVLKQGGEISFEWPRFCSGWRLPELIDFIVKWDLYTCAVDGCAFGLKDKDGVPIKKPWPFITSCQRQAVSLSNARCRHAADFKHSIAEGPKTLSTERYPVPLCRTLLGSLYGGYRFAPAMPCTEFKPHVHRAYQHLLEGFAIESHGKEPKYNIPGSVTRVLSKKEIASSPDAQKAILKEADALVENGTWDLSTVIEKRKLQDWARSKGSGFKVHIGGLLTLCSEKHAESSDPAKREKKGRICFIGNRVYDQDGVMAVFQTLSASPTSVHSSNINLFYGALVNNKTTQSDALRAYVQSYLKSKHPTYVELPRALWPADWHGKYERPCCLLVRALYGHPESGGHWERHLQAALHKCGAVPVANHPSTFWVAKTKMLTVYVDDLLLSGPREHHEATWKEIRQHVRLDPPEELDVFLGRKCRVTRGKR